MIRTARQQLLPSSRPIGNARRQQYQRSVMGGRRRQLQSASARLWNIDSAQDEISSPAYSDDLTTENIGDNSGSDREDTRREDSDDPGHVSSNRASNDDEDDDSDHSDSEPSTSPSPEVEPPFWIHGLEVWVEGDGKRLPEYLDPDEDQQEARERRRRTRYVEYEPGTIATLPYKIARDFECRVTADGPALKSRFLLDGKIMQNHVDNPKYMRPKDQDFFDEFPGLSLGRAKTGPMKAGRRKVIYRPIMFRPRGYGKSTGNDHRGAQLTTARR